MARCPRMAALIAAGLLACGQETPPLVVDPPDETTLRAALQSIMAANDLPSLSAMLIEGDTVVEIASVGMRAVGTNVQVTDNDRWHLGSLTKAMTATLAAILVEDGIISWSTTVTEVFPDFLGIIRGEYESVRLEELLAHVSGLPVDVTQTPLWPNLRNDPAPLPDQRRRWAAELLSLQPGATRGSYLYSNAGYVIAGAMLEELTGEPWEDLIQQRVFDPLGMASTGFGAPGSPGSTPDQPRGHVRQGSQWVALEPDVFADNPAALGPAGTVHSTLRDYGRFVSAHLAGAQGTAGLLPATAFEKLHTPAPGSDYALGWNVQSRNWAGGRTLAHAGSNTLWYAVVWIAPARDMAMVAATNAGGDGAAQGTDLAVQELLERFQAAGN